MSSSASQLLTESRSAEAAGNIAVALQRAADALEKSRVDSNQEMIASALCRVAAIHWRIGHFARAQVLASEAATCTAAAITQVDALIVTGGCSIAHDNLIAGENSLLRAIDLSREIGYPAGHSQALQHLASLVYLRRGQFDLALTTANKAVRLCPDNQQSLIWLLRAWVYQITGNRQHAHEALNELRRLAPDDGWISAAINYLAAQVSLDEGDLEQARTLLDEALVVAETSGHPLLSVSLPIGFSRWHRLNLDNVARDWAANAVATARRLGSLYLEGQALIAHGHAAWQVGDLKLAVADLECALGILDELGAAYDAAHAALLLSALYQQLHHAEAEAVWLDAARRITAGGYGFLLERERPLALPLLAAQRHSDEPEVYAATDRLLGELIRVPPPPLHIIGLGDFVVRQGHCCISAHAWEQRKAGELFRFLLIQSHYRACRDVIIEALWPDKQHNAAERFLQQAIWALRHALEPDLPERFPSRYLTVADHHLGLQLPPGSTVDFVQFERAIYDAFTGSIDALERALALYRGDLFPGDRYRDWCVGAHQRLTDHYVRGLLYLAEQYQAYQRPQQALDCCDRMLAQERWNEEATLIAMRACLVLGDRPGALRRYEALKRALHHDLHLTPRADLRELAEAIRAET